jgi:hypothetical protein
MSSLAPEQLGAIQEHFVAALKPRIEAYAHIFFGHHRKNPELMEELTQQAMANAWKSFLKKHELGENPSEYLSMMAARACQGARNGRKMQGGDSLRNVSNPITQRERGFYMGKLPDVENCADLDNALMKALADTRHPSPYEEARFNIDTKAWLDQLGSPKKEMAQDMVKGETTMALAEKYGKSQGRISQIRGQLIEDNRRFYGEEKPKGR